MPLPGYDKTTELEDVWLQTPPYQVESLRDALNQIIGVKITAGTRVYLWLMVDGEYRLIQ